ncbi:MAG: DUF1080 domain-containing protein [Edaphobacter sp.]|uniref:family 16 glycoside hydrolase n=1 Tax=Edaphobacter sp. TaxID=1934404 RepID=UPI0023861624|nr:family 16 glycoside hydrolase [Edaphobacter sp.]MDE1175818.1 DUF1080 domain-containing protein [Edaphobacter sp.]
MDRKYSGNRDNQAGMPAQRGWRAAICRGLVGGLMLMAVSVTCGTDAGAQAKAKIPGDDWIQLFNGTDLMGWTKIGAESWTVEDGLLHGRGLTKAYGYLETEHDYKDFTALAALQVCWRR